MSQGDSGDRIKTLPGDQCAPGAEWQTLDCTTCSEHRLLTCQRLTRSTCSKLVHSVPRYLLQWGFVMVGAGLRCPYSVRGGGYDFGPDMTLGRIEEIGDE